MIAQRQQQTLQRPGVKRFAHRDAVTICVCCRYCRTSSAMPANTAAPHGLITLHAGLERSIAVPSVSPSPTRNAASRRRNCRLSSSAPPTARIRPHIRSRAPGWGCIWRDSCWSSYTVGASGARVLSGKGAAFTSPCPLPIIHWTIERIPTMKFGVFTVMLPDLTPEAANPPCCVWLGYDGVEWRCHDGTG